MLGFLFFRVGNAGLKLLPALMGTCILISVAPAESIRFESKLDIVLPGQNLHSIAGSARISDALSGQLGRSFRVSQRRASLKLVRDRRLVPGALQSFGSDDYQINLRGTSNSNDYAPTLMKTLFNRLPRGKGQH